MKSYAIMETGPYVTVPIDYARTRIGAWIKLRRTRRILGEFARAPQNHIATTTHRIVRRAKA